MSNHYRTKQVILMRTDLRDTRGNKVRSGKLMAQAAHASIMWLSKRVQAYLAPSEYPGTASVGLVLTTAEREWIEGSFAKIVLGVESEAQMQYFVDLARSAGIVAEVCVDNGTTEFGGVKTATCAAIGPDLSEKIDQITGALKPL